MSCSFPPSPLSSRGGDGEEEKVPGGGGDHHHQQQPEALPSVVLRLKAYPNVSLHTDDARRAAVMTLLPATIPTLADAATIQQPLPEIGGDAPPPADAESESAAAAVFPCLLLRERELAQFLLYLQEILQEIRALPLLPD